MNSAGNWSSLSLSGSVCRKEYHYLVLNNKATVRIPASLGSGKGFRSFRGLAPAPLHVLFLPRKTGMPCCFWILELNQGITLLVVGNRAHNYLSAKSAQAPLCLLEILRPPDATRGLYLPPPRSGVYYKQLSPRYRSVYHDNGPPSTFPDAHALAGTAAPHPAYRRCRPPLPLCRVLYREILLGPKLCRPAGGDTRGRSPGNGAGHGGMAGTTPRKRRRFRGRSFPSIRENQRGPPNRSGGRTGRRIPG
ncbi:MAG: hypothetical protein BWX80_02169 [Candidatus Hydrogenedentes bacterium ADurb.Bin101]|nr:MAG: hypothetical protein BWX80_02169 [Candidatus Hydrogenedentes bacterium ADurb.Bin101]